MDTDAQNRFREARHETIRYHEELYRTSALGATDTWLARPHPFVLTAIDDAAALGPVTAYDLGAGVGRHTLHMVSRLTAGSSVVAVDLLDSALSRLRSNLEGNGAGVHLQTVRADLADFAFERPAGLVVAFSTLEHLPGAVAIADLLRRMASATQPGGIVVIGMVTDRVEVDASGSARPALVESRLAASQARDLLQTAFAGWETTLDDSGSARVTETRDGSSYTLASTLVLFRAVRPSRE